MRNRVSKRKEEAVRNNPGISKILDWDCKSKKWIDSGKFRAMRRVQAGNGQSKKESGFFDSIEEAKMFRIGRLEKSQNGKHHKSSFEESDETLRFEKLVEEWKSFHFLTIDFSTQQTYEKRLPALSFLDSVCVDEIDAQVIDRMIKYWRQEYPLGKSRISFEKELMTLKVVLNFYRRRYNSRFLIPIFKEHYQAAVIVRRAQQPVRSLKPDDLGKFLKALQRQKNPVYFMIALTQFGLGLRIGEACGLHWEALDFKNGVAKIEKTIVWDQKNWQPKVKDRPKNGHVRFLVMPEILKQALHSLYLRRDKSTDLVFHDRGEPLIRKTIGKAYKRALDLCNIDYVSGTHLIRKTSATQANRVTGDFYAVSKNLGHSSLDETQRYVEEVDEGKHKVAQALDQVTRTVLALAEQSESEKINPKTMGSSELKKNGVG